MNRLTNFVRATAIVLLAGSGWSVAHAQSSSEAIATEHVSPTGINWQIHAEYDSVVLTVAGPNGLVFREEYETNPSYALVDDDGQPLADGSYNYELILTPRVDSSTKKILEAARGTVDQSDGDVALELSQELGLPTESASFSGHFRLVGGNIVTGGVELSSSTLNAPSNLLDSGPSNLTAEPLLVAENLYVIGKACVGQSCVNGESFGFETLKLKEDNTRLLFTDTSVSAGFPTVDWQLTANESSNGGANKFSIDDIDNSRVPFTIEAASPNNSLYVDSTGNIGFNTSTPVLELHVKDGDSPALRLEQDGSAGFGLQTWDVAGNEANFFVRDVTNGSKLPFKIRPNAATDSVVLAAGGVGLGTDDPRDRLHLANGVLRVEATDGSTPGLRFVNSERSWLFENRKGGIFAVRDETDGTTPFRVFPGGEENTLVLANGRVGIGTLNPSARLDVSGPILQRGGVLQADYVFDPGYELESIEEHASFMWRERHLPAVPKKSVDASGEEVVEIGAQRRGILEELEKAHIYIEQLNNAIEQKQARIDGLESENAEILERLSRLEALLSERDPREN